MIKPGDPFPRVTLQESKGYDEASHCPTAPEPVDTETLMKGKTVVVFGLPGAFTPTCSGKHLPGYVEAYDELKAKGVDEIVCVSVNDAFVMGAWGRDQKVGSKVRMLADGNGELAKKLGLDADFSPFSMGTRCKRFSMLVKDGIVQKVNVEEPKKFEVSDAKTMVGQVSA